MRRTLPIAITILAAAAGIAFAAVSTHDFVQHLDRQVHGLHCSFLPGLDEADVSGETGCHVTLMSPYSSVLREAVWGGVPISLPAIAVFAFLAAWGVLLLAVRRQGDVRAVGFLLAAWGVPVIASAAMGYVALETLDAACKLCIGIYASSGVGFFAALVAFVFAFRASRHVRPRPVESDDEDRAEDRPPSPPARPAAVEPLGWAALGGAFAVGVAFVLVPVGAYAAAAPDFSRFVGSCGQLADSSDPHDILLPLGPQTREVPVIEVLDPLCPACRGFEARFEASSIDAQASRRVLLFPLDDTCNWMIDRSIHPGACAVSEAVLCADGDAEEVIDWAFENQEAITEAARADPEAAPRMVRRRFPSLADCIGSPTVQARLNQSLRWAVQNELPVLTPQVYVGAERLCDADTDLGMDYALSRLVARYREDPTGHVPIEDVADTEESAPEPAAAAPRETAPRSIELGPARRPVEPEAEAEPPPAPEAPAVEGTEAPLVAPAAPLPAEPATPTPIAPAPAQPAAEDPAAEEPPPTAPPPQPASEPAPEEVPE